MCAAAVALLLVFGIASVVLFAPGDFMPHGYCYRWIPGLVWLHGVSDALIFLAYTTIPITLIHIVRRRKDLPFNWIFVCFGVFIVACGLTHAIGASGPSMFNRNSLGASNTSARKSPVGCRIRISRSAFSSRSSSFGKQHRQDSIKPSARNRE